MYKRQAIGRLERFTSDWAFAHPEEAAAAMDGLREECAAGDELACSIWRGAEGAVSQDLAGKRVAVIGSGPASLTCAGELVTVSYTHLDVYKRQTGSS